MSQAHESGKVVLDAILSKSLGATPATADDDRIVLVHTEGVGNTVILREGDPAPDTVGGVFGAPGGAWLVATGANTFNAAGELALVAELTGGDVVAGVDDRGVYVVGASGPSPVARRGDPAPGSDGSLDVFHNASLCLNGSGAVALRCSLAGGSVTAADDTCVVTGTAGALALVAREGNPAPELPGHTFGDLALQSLSLNDAGQILMGAPVVETATGLERSALYVYDPAIGLCLALVEGEALEVAPGVFKTASAFGASQFGDTDGASLSFGHDGAFALRINMTDGTQAVARARAGSLIGTPATVSESTGGTQTLHLRAGAARAGQIYFLLGSLTGTSPGLPVDTLVLPLNFDAYFLHTLSKPNKPPLSNSLSVLDAEGRSTASFTLPSGLTGLVGFTAHHAFATLTPLGATFVSEPAAVEFVP